MEKDAFIEPDLTNSYFDVLLSCKFNHKDGYIFLLLEKQSTSDHFMAFRLLRYMVNICSQYLTKHPKAKKLPVILPSIIYNGKKKYSASRNVWDLFNNPELMKSLWMNDYAFLNVHDIPDEELRQQMWFGVMLFFLKHIHERELLQCWEEISYLLSEIKTIGVTYNHDLGQEDIENLLEYILPFIDKNDILRLKKILKSNLSQEGEEIMMSITEAWKAEGKAEAKAKIMSIAQTLKNEGKAEENTRVKIEIAKNMLANNYPIPDISKITGLSISQINDLLQSK